MITNRFSWIERISPIYIGLAEAFLGIIIILFSIFAIPIGIKLPIWLSKLIADLGVGFISAGIITGTLEPISRIRLQADIEEIKQAHFESTIKGMMSLEIFEEIKNHIIRHPFERRNFRIMSDLDWVDESKEYLVNDKTVSYEVKNISRTIQIFELRISDERKNEDRFPNNIRLKTISIHRESNEKPIFLSNEEIQNSIDETEEYVRVFIPVKIKPGEKVKISTRRENILESSDLVWHVANKATIGMEYTLSHPKDLLVNAIPMHPSAESFIETISQSKLKRWQISAGVLPYQGFQILWRPRIVEEVNG